MKKKMLTSIACFALALIGAVSFVGCGAKGPVTFGSVSGNYTNDRAAASIERNPEGRYKVASSTWKKVDTKDGITAAWELTSNVKYDLDTHDALFSYDNLYNFVAITVRPESGVKVNEPVANGKSLVKNGKEWKYVLIKGLNKDTKDFTINVQWNSEDENTKFVYEFQVEKAIADGKLQSAPVDRA